LLRCLTLLEVDEVKKLRLQAVNLARPSALLPEDSGRRLAFGLGGFQSGGSFAAALRVKGRAEVLQRRHPRRLTRGTHPSIHQRAAASKFMPQPNRIQTRRSRVTWPVFHLREPALCRKSLRKPLEADKIGYMHSDVR